MSQFNGKNVVVMGLGRFGGGIGVARWLSEQGADVLVTDLSAESDLRESMEALSGRQIRFRLGGHDAGDLSACDLLVVSPAVDKTRSDFFQQSQLRGIPWTSEMTLFLERCPSLVVGITGTVGKSTTTAMVGAILERASEDAGWKHGRVWLGGNIGKSLLADLGTMRPEDVVVLELSSFQLEDIDRIRRSPNIALVTNVRDNHLDRHGTLAAYATAKGNIYKYQKETDWLLLPNENGIEWLPDGWQDRSHICRFAADPTSRRIKLQIHDNGQEQNITVDCKPSVPGLHNLQNAAGAVGIARLLGVPDDVSAAALAEFRGLPHRLEFVREYRGVKYYNDSKATTPEAAMTSLQAFDEPVIALVGGSDKGSDFGPLGKFLATKVKAVVCMGATKEKILAAIREVSPSSVKEKLSSTAAHSRAAVSSSYTGASTAMLSPSTRIESADDFRGALEAGRHLASPGDVVVLSPACASFDWFKNYEDRGEQFKKIVMSWKE